MFAALDLASSNGEAVDLDNDTSAGAQSATGHLCSACGDFSAHVRLCHHCGVRLCQLVDD